MCGGDILGRFLCHWYIGQNRVKARGREVVPSWFHDNGNGWTPEIHKKRDLYLLG